jgi:outer membrane receptor for ferrienterochelin and colicin
MFMKKLAGGAALSVLSMAMASAVYAQETSAAAHGIVTAGGAPVSGASVQFVHTPSGTRFTTSSDSVGGYDARGLRIGGPYTVTVTGKGLPPKVVDNVFLTVGKTTDVNVDLTGANEVEAIVVTAAGVKDSDQGPKTVLNRQAIQEVVTINRDPRDLARRDMLVVQDTFNGRAGVNGGGISIAGSNPRLNRVAVDGVSAQDNFGLNQGGLTTARGPVTLDAIEQFAVAAVPTDVENGDFVGGALNLALRSGGNTVHGVVFYNYLNDGFVGKKSEDQTIKTKQSQTNYGLFLSGPIWEDHAFFAISYENYQTSQTFANGFAGSGAATNFLNPGTSGPAVLQSVINTFNSTYASKYDPGVIPTTTPFVDKKYSAKLDWNITDNQRASFTYRFAASTSTAHPQSGTTALQLTSQDYVKDDSDESMTFELHSKWTDKFTTTLKATKRDFLDHQLPASGQNFSDVRICLDPIAEGSSAIGGGCDGSKFDTVFFGPDQFRHFNQLAEQETRYQVTGEYSLTNNLLKFGAQARNAKPKDEFIPGYKGVYYFDSIADFNAGRASDIQYANAVSGNPLDAGFSTSYWTYSAYGQDTLNITDDLKVAAGFRFDMYKYPAKPALNPNFQPREGFTNQKTIDGQKIVMPRLSVEWKATPTLKLTAGGGLFSGGVPDVLTGLPFYNTGYVSTSIDILRGADGVSCSEVIGQVALPTAFCDSVLNHLNTNSTFGYQVPAGVQALQQGTLIPGVKPAPNPAASVIALAPSFQLPAQWKLFLSGQWEVFDGINLTADFVATRVKNEFTYYDGRAVPLIINGVQQYLPDGRLRYNGLTGAGLVGTGLAANPGSGTDLIVGTSHQGDGYTVSFTASKSWDWGGDVSLGYAHQNLNDVTQGVYFGTVLGSLYTAVPAGNDPNHDFLGRSAYEIPNRYKAEFGYHHKFFGDNETRIAVFMERSDGRPYGFISTDLGSNRGPVFGVVRTAQELYVPDLSTPNPANPLQYGFVTFATAADLANFKRAVANFKLPTGLLSKYTNDNAPVGRMDMSISQQLPTLVQGHKLRVQVDIRNVLNLINQKWGEVAEYDTTVKLASVQCANAAGVAQPSTSATCAGYVYSQVPNVIQKNRNNDLSLWYAQISLRYEF